MVTPITDAASARVLAEPCRTTRPSRLDGLLVLGIVVVFAMLPLGSSRWGWWLPLTLVLGGLTTIAFRRRCAAAVPLGILSTLILLALLTFGGLTLWPLPAVLATGSYLAATKLVPALGGLPLWLRRGRLDRTTAALIVSSILVSAVALAVWFRVTRPDYRALRGTLLPELPLPLLICGVVLFAMFNGALEEFVYRGAIMGALDATLGRGVAPVIIQAVAFGVLHIGGFPRGAVGVCLATVYGLMMGTVRRHSDGMLAPWIAHVGADIAIGAILLKALF